MKVKEILNKKEKRSDVLEAVTYVQFKSSVGQEVLEKIIDTMKRRMSVWKIRNKVRFNIVDDTRFQYSIYADNDSPLETEYLYDASRTMGTNLIELLDELNLKGEVQYIAVDYQTNELDDDGNMALKV